MFWSGAKLKARLTSIVTENYDPDRIDCAAYTLTMGAEVYVSPPSERAPQDVVKLGDGGSFNIPPGQFAFLLSEERLKLPPDVLGFINMKSKIKLRGLVNVSGFHIDPGYEGKLVFSVFNAGPRPVTIRRGDQCFLLWLADLAPSPLSTDPAADYISYARNGTGFDGIESQLVTNVGGNLLSLNSLNEKIEKMTGRTDRLIVILSVLVTASASLVVGQAIRFLSGT